MFEWQFLVTLPSCTIYISCATSVEGYMYVYIYIILYYIILYFICTVYMHIYIYRQYRYPQKEVELLFQDGIDDIYPIMSFLGFQLLYLFLGLLWVDRIWTLQKSSLKWLYLFTFHIVSTPRWFYSWPWFTIYGLLCIRTHTHIYIYIYISFHPLILILNTPYLCSQTCGFIPYIQHGFLGCV